jgi:hypothetical protein
MSPPKAHGSQPVGTAHPTAAEHTNPTSAGLQFRTAPKFLQSQHRFDESFIIMNQDCCRVVIH